jgi:hypothetical protein
VAVVGSLHTNRKETTTDIRRNNTQNNTKREHIKQKAKHTKNKTIIKRNNNIK